MKTVKLLCALLLPALMLVPLPASALSSDRNQPIDIIADKLQIDDAKHVSIYQGNVDMRQGSLHIKADRVELYFNAQNELLRLEIEGEPATLKQTSDAGEPVSGSAKHIIYSDNQLQLKLSGDARFISNKDSIDSEWITINTDTDAINAGSIKGKNRVRMLIQPKNSDAKSAQ
jgi:lipopolysaccharide export system protein LptA